MSDVRTWKIIVTGKVQGVYFRASTQQKARALELKGWVRNQSDGSVKIIAQGTESNLKSLRDWVQEGPERAEVDQVKWEKTDKGQTYEDFNIKR